MLTAQKITPARFSFEIPFRDAANGIYSAFQAEVANRGRELNFDSATRKHIEDAARWLIDPHGKFGLMLIGTTGNGKTTMMRAIARLIAFATERVLGYSKRIVPKMVKARAITRMSITESQSNEYEELFKTKILCIDELGEEATEVLRYGNMEVPLIEVLSERYDRQRMTIITTNLTEADLRDKYGDRIYDRFREMMEIHVYVNESYRGD